MVDAVDEQLATKLEGLAAALRRGDIADLYITWMDHEGQAVVIHMGEDAIMMCEASLEVKCEKITGGLN